MSRQSIVLLVGGTSAEREVSLRSGEKVLEALDKALYDVRTLDTGQAGWVEELLHGPKPDVAVLILHGPGGEDGVVQGLLESLGIPFVGSGVLSSALCMDKELTKIVLRSEGIPVPQSFTVSADDRAKSGFADKLSELPLPLIVKPNRQGSTHGTTRVTDSANLEAAVDLALEFDDHVLLEELVSGIEITASVIGGEELQVLPLIEIVPQSGFYDYHDKYTPGATDEIVPARISPRRAEQARRYALMAHKRLRCWGMSRTDMIVGDRQTWVLEVNTIPGMTGTSLLPKAAGAAGISLTELFNKLIEWAKQRPTG